MAKASLVLIAFLVVIPHVALPTKPSGPLDLRMEECASREPTTLRDALGRMGGCVSSGYVLFGLEEVQKEGKEPAVVLKVRQGMTLGAALKQILRQIPPYEIEVVSDHLIDLFPRGAKTDPDNLMNLRIPSFDCESVGLDTVLGAPRDVIPQLSRALTPKPEPGRRAITLYVQGFNPSATPITLHLKNVTVRDILNSATLASDLSFPRSEALGWVYAFDPSRPLSSGSRYRWATLYSLPNGWRYKMRKAEAPSLR